MGQLRFGGSLLLTHRHDYSVLSNHVYYFCPSGLVHRRVPCPQLDRRQCFLHQLLLRKNEDSKHMCTTPRPKSLLRNLHLAQFCSDQLKRLCYFANQTHSVTFIVSYFNCMMFNRNTGVRTFIVTRYESTFFCK